MQTKNKTFSIITTYKCFMISSWQITKELLNVFLFVLLDICYYATVYTRIEHMICVCFKLEDSSCSY